jgi:hypothetical protein
MYFVQLPCFAAERPGFSRNWESRKRVGGAVDLTLPPKREFSIRGTTSSIHMKNFPRWPGCAITVTRMPRMRAGAGREKRAAPAKTCRENERPHKKA